MPWPSAPHGDTHYRGGTGQVNNILTAAGPSARRPARVVTWTLFVRNIAGPDFASEILIYMDGKLYTRKCIAFIPLQGRTMERNG